MNNESQRSELVSARQKITKMRKELRNLGKAHQWLWDKHRILATANRSLLDQLTRAAHRQGKMGNEVRQLKGWNLEEYHKWLVGLDDK